MTAQTKRIYEFGPFRVDSGERVLLRDGRPEPLSPKAFDVLLMLLESSGHIVEKDVLMNRVWAGSFVEEGNLKVTVSALRKALERGGGEHQFIETVPRRGYRFTADVRELPGSEPELMLLERSRVQMVIEKDEEPGDLCTTSNANYLNSLLVQDKGIIEQRAVLVRERARVGSLDELIRTVAQHKRRLMIAAAVLVTAAAGVSFGVYSLVSWKQFQAWPEDLLWFYIPASSPKSSLPPMKVVPFTSFPGVENLGSFSPDGNQIAFGWNGENGDKDQHSSIYVKQIGSERPLRLTFDTAHNDWGPVWSPDGQRIAFNRQSDTDCAIYIVPALGGAERKVLTCPNTSLGGLTTLAWSPDGKYIAFTSKDPKEEPAKIHLVSPDTFARRTLTSPSAENAGDLTPAFSPDSQRVAFARQSSAGTADIYIVPITGGEPTRLTFDNAVLRGLAWTADGREIIFSSSRADGGAGQHYDFGLAFISGLWRISASGGAAERVTIGGLNFFFPNISRQGNRLTYVQRSPEDANIYRIDISDTTVSKNPPTKLIASTRHDGGPQFSPDGKRIVFHSARSGPLEIWICDSDGTNFVQLTFLNRRAGSPRWSPDGQQIVFDFYEEGKGDIYVISAEGGVPRPIVTGDADDHLPNWSRDGKWIYFASDRSGKHQVWKVPAEGGEAVQVTIQGGVLPCESPDGRYVYYSKGLGTRGLWRVPVDSDEEVRVLDSFKSELGVVVNEGIYFINPDAKGGAALEFFDFATRKERHVAGLGKITIFPSCVAVSPDGRCILYTQNDQIGADIMLVENFR
jgi:Tol biopolymer transport system component/DNA-binding winged helix-turn-helix (wHTH) protein